MVVYACLSVSINSQIWDIYTHSVAQRWLYVLHYSEPT